MPHRSPRELTPAWTLLFHSKALQKVLLTNQTSLWSRCSQAGALGMKGGWEHPGCCFSIPWTWYQCFKKSTSCIFFNMCFVHGNICLKSPKTPVGMKTQGVTNSCRGAVPGGAEFLLHSVQNSLPWPGVLGFCFKDLRAAVKNLLNKVGWIKT